MREITKEGLTSPSFRRRLSSSSPYHLLIGVAVGLLLVIMLLMALRRALCYTQSELRIGTLTLENYVISNSRR